MIDAQIPLQVRPVQQVQVPNLIDRYSQIASLQNAQAETQLRQKEGAVQDEKLKQDQIATANAQRAQHDAESVRQAFIQTGGNPDQTIAAAIKNGAGPDAITGLQKHFQDLKDKAAETDKKTLDLNISKHDQTLTLLDQANQLATGNPAAYQQAWPQILAQAAQIDPETSKHFSPDQPATPQQLATAKAVIMTSGYFLKSEAERRANEKAQQEAAQAAQTLAKTKNEVLTTTPNAQGLTPEQVQTAKQAADTLAETKARDEATRLNQAGELGIKQAAENRQNKEFQAKYGTPDSRGRFTDMVKQNPDSYFSLPPDVKIGVANDLAAQGIPVPTQLPSDLKNRAVSASLSLSTIDRIQQLLKDPEVNANGPIEGRISKLMEKAGVGLSSKEQELLTNLNTLTYQESKGLIGGRPSTGIIEAIKAASASPEKGPQQMQGALKAMSDAAKSVSSEAKTYSFGGASATGAAASPAVPTPKSQFEYNALRSGDQYKKPGDDKVYVKK